MNFVKFNLIVIIFFFVSCNVLYGVDHLTEFEKNMFNEALKDPDFKKILETEAGMKQFLKMASNMEQQYKTTHNSIPSRTNSSGPNIGFFNKVFKKNTVIIYFIVIIFLIFYVINTIINIINFIDKRKKKKKQNKLQKQMKKNLTINKLIQTR